MARATPPKAMALRAALESSVPVGAGGSELDGVVVFLDGDGVSLVDGTEVVEVSVSVTLVAEVSVSVAVVVGGAEVEEEPGSEVVETPGGVMVKVTPACRQSSPAAARTVSNSPAPSQAPVTHGMSPVMKSLDEQMQAMSVVWQPVSTMPPRAHSRAHCGMASS